MQLWEGGGGGAGLGGLRWGLTLSLPQGSLLKVVLEDYLRLKKLFAQRMVQKASSCHSSISEVAGWAGELCAVPQPWGCSVFLSCCLCPSQSLELSSQDQREQWVGLQEARQWAPISVLCSGQEWGGH